MDATDADERFSSNIHGMVHAQVHFLLRCHGKQCDRAKQCRGQWRGALPEWNQRKVTCKHPGNVADLQPCHRSVIGFSCRCDLPVGQAV